MRLRLAYAVAVAIEPSILIVDELLAVGDEAFQRRCSKHIARFLERGGTLVLASHNLYQVEKLCGRAIWLDEGRVRRAGPSRSVTADYQASLGEPVEVGSATEIAGRKIEIEVAGDGEAEVTAGAPMTIRVIAPAPPPEGACLELGLPDGAAIAAFPLVPSRDLALPRCPLVPGRYRVRLRSGPDGRVLAVRSFECRGASRELGSVRLPHAWG
jgi:lipopolysaccharide transport system ATP-binding protein